MLHIAQLPPSKKLSIREFQTRFQVFPDFHTVKLFPPLPPIFLLSRNVASSGPEFWRAGAYRQSVPEAPLKLLHNHAPSQRAPADASDIATTLFSSRKHSPPGWWGQHLPSGTVLRAAHFHPTETKTEELFCDACHGIFHIYCESEVESINVV